MGTTFPHLARAVGSALPWRAVMLVVSATASSGAALLLWLVSEGPRLTAVGPAAPSGGRELLHVFWLPDFRAAALGYFGHMWELYAFWAFLPAMVAGRLAVACHHDVRLGVRHHRRGHSRLRGRWSDLGARRRHAATQLAWFGLSCALLPVLFLAPAWLFFASMLLWGVAVVGDSPQYSALNAASAPPAQVGSVLTLVVSVGFAITIGSIELLGLLTSLVSVQYLALPLLVGLIAMRRLLQKPDPKPKPAAA